MIECEFCGKWLRSKYALKVHKQSAKACKTLQKLFSNIQKTNGIIESLNSHSSSENNDGIEQIKNDISDLKSVIEEIKWALKGFVHFSKRKKMTEEQDNKDKSGYIDCLDELKERFNQNG